jgi:hypothetical protein
VSKKEIHIEEKDSIKEKNSFNEISVNNPLYFPPPTPPVTTPVLTISVLMPDGELKEFPEDKIFNDENNCLISDGGKYYHICVDCCWKWSKEAFKNFKGWKLVSVDEAKNMGLNFCLICDEELRKAQNFFD